MCEESESVENKTEFFFQRLEEAYSVAESASQYITDTVNCSLCNQDIDGLLSLISYIETGKGYSAYRYVGETNRILNILHIIELERKRNKTLFLEGCENKDALLEKYMLSLYAFRRILFHLSDTSVEEAVLYLQQSRLSVYAVYIITQRDLILPDDLFYKSMEQIYSDFWDGEDAWLLNSLVGHG